MADVIAPLGVLEDGVEFLAEPFSGVDFARKVWLLLDRVS
jgi:hypothetical protein